MYSIDRSTIYLSIFLYLLYGVIIPVRGHDDDMACWANWAAYIYDHGLGNAYSSGSNYLPAHLFELKLYTLFCNSPDEVVQKIYWVKYFTLFFDIFGSLLVCSLISQKSIQAVVLIVLMFNPGYLHNSLLWGQFDSVFSSLAFASFLAIYNRKFLIGIVLFILSFNFKFQAIVFFPTLLLLIFYRYESKKDIRQIALGIILSIVTQLIFWLPFILKSNLSQVLHVFKSSSAEFNAISLNAGNFWQLIIDGDLRWTYDWITFLHIPLKKWGLLLFSSALFITIFPLVRAIYIKIKDQKIQLPFNSLLLIFALSPLMFFYFNTQMHERYSYPAFLFLAAYAVNTGRWWVYLLFSLAYFLNNELCLQVNSRVDYSSFAYNFKFISILFLIAISTIVGMLYFDTTKMKTTK